MAMRIRVTMKADLYDKRKQERIERGYRIEDERPIPVNGFCSFYRGEGINGLGRTHRVGDSGAEWKPCRL
jgi:hypothetical protein